MVKEGHLQRQSNWYKALLVSLDPPAIDTGDALFLGAMPKELVDVPSNASNSLTAPTTSPPALSTAS